MTHSILEILIKQTTKTQRVNCGLSFFLFLCWCNHGERETAKITVALPHPIPPLLLSFLWVENCPPLSTNSSPPPRHFIANVKNSLTLRVRYNTCFAIQIFTPSFALVLTALTVSLCYWLLSRSTHPTHPCQFARICQFANYQPFRGIMPGDYIGLCPVALWHYFEPVYYATLQQSIQNSSKTSKWSIA